VDRIFGRNVLKFSSQNLEEHIIFRFESWNWDICDLMDRVWRNSESSSGWNSGWNTSIFLKSPHWAHYKLNVTNHISPLHLLRLLKLALYRFWGLYRSDFTEKSFRHSAKTWGEVPYIPAPAKCAVPPQ